MQAGIRIAMKTIERYVLELIGENADSPDVFLDTDAGMEPVRDSINDAIEEISLFTGMMKRNYIIALRESRTFYRFRFTKGYLGWITDVWLVNQKRRLEQTSLIKLTGYNPRWMFNSGSPHSYFPIGFNFFGVFPRPSSDTDALEITAVMVPDRYTSDTDKLNLRKNWQWAAAHYAVGEFYASRGDARQAIYHHNEYLSRMGLNYKYPAANERQWQMQTDKVPWPKATG